MPMEGPRASSRSGTGRDEDTDHLETARRSPTSCSRASPARSSCRRHKIRVIAPDLGGGFRHQGLRLRRGCARAAGGARARPTGEVDRDPAGSTCRAPAHARSPGRIAISLARAQGRHDSSACGNRIWLDLGAYNVLGHRAAVQHGGAPAGAAPRGATCAWEVAGRGHPQERPTRPIAAPAVPRTVFAMGPARSTGLARQLGLDPRGDPPPQTTSPRATCRGTSAMPYRDGQPAHLRQRRFPRGRSTAALEAAGLRRVSARSSPRYAIGESGAALASPATSRAPPSGPFEGARVHARPRRSRAGRHRRAVKLGSGATRDVVRPGRGRRARCFPSDWVTVIGGGQPPPVPFGVGHLRQPQRGHGGQAPSWTRARAVRAQGRHRRGRACWRRRRATSRVEDGRVFVRGRAGQPRLPPGARGCRPRSRRSPSPASPRPTSMRAPITTWPTVHLRERRPRGAGGRSDPDSGAVRAAALRGRATTAAR